MKIVKCKIYGFVNVFNLQAGWQKQRMYIVNVCLEEALRQLPEKYIFAVGRGLYSCEYMAIASF